MQIHINNDVFNVLNLSNDRSILVMRSSIAKTFYMPGQKYIGFLSESFKYGNTKRIAER